jgi:hypothetical protein
VSDESLKPLTEEIAVRTMIDSVDWKVNSGKGFDPPRQFIADAMNGIPR